MTGNKELTFELTADHVKLLQKMYVGWNGAETGAPEIDPKRPYGNSDVEGDVADLLGWDRGGRDGELSEEVEEAASKLHRETETALQIVLSAGSFEPGLYSRETAWAREWSRTDWREVKKRELAEKRVQLEATRTALREARANAAAAEDEIARLEAAPGKGFGL